MKFLNKIISIFLLVLFFVLTGQNTIAYLYFKINQNYIAKNLCVQKEIKDNFCLGNCYLAAIEKRLNKNKDEKSSHGTPVKYNTNHIQEYITEQTFEFNRTEKTIVFHNFKTYQILTKYYVPSVPPPEFI